MVRGPKPKDDAGEIGALFELTDPSWTSTPESEERRRMILDSGWRASSMQESTKTQYKCSLRSWIRYAKLHNLTSLQDSDMKVCRFFHWLLDNFKEDNANQQQKALMAPVEMLKLAIQALSCVKRCQMGVQDQALGWKSSNLVIRGAFDRAKKMQSELKSSPVCSSGLDSKIFTRLQYNDFLDAGWVLGTTPEAARKGGLMLVEATAAVNCGFRGGEDTPHLRPAGLAVADVAEDVGPAQMVPLLFVVRRAGSKVSRTGAAEYFALVENSRPEACPALAAACLLIQNQGGGYQQAFLDSETDEAWWHTPLLATDALEPANYQQLRALLKKMMAGLDLDDEKFGVALHIFRNTGDNLLHLAGASKAQIDQWGRWASGGGSSVEMLSYAQKSALHTRDAQALLGGWGKEFRKEFFLGRSEPVLDPILLERYTALLRPTLARTEAEVERRLAELKRRIPAQERQWSCNIGRLNVLKDMANSVKAERRLIRVFLYGLPLLFDKYGADLVIFRSSAAVQELLLDLDYLEYADRVRAAHEAGLLRQETAKLPMADQVALQHSEHLAEMQKAARLQQSDLLRAMQAMLSGASPEAAASGQLPPDVSTDRGIKRNGPAARRPAKVARTGALGFDNKLETVFGAFEEWPRIEAQVASFGGLNKVGKSSATNFGKRRHLVQRIRLIMAEHGLSKEVACGVYQRIMDQAGFSVSELRDAVNHAEPIPDPHRRGGVTASRLDTDVMPRAPSKPPVTKRQILDMRDEALRLAGVSV